MTHRTFMIIAQIIIFGFATPLIFARIYEVKTKNIVDEWITGSGLILYRIYFDLLLAPVRLLIGCALSAIGYPTTLQVRVKDRLLIIDDPLGPVSTETEVVLERLTDTELYNITEKRVTIEYEYPRSETARRALHRSYEQILANHAKHILDQRRERGI